MRQDTFIKVALMAAVLVLASTRMGLCEGQRDSSGKGRHEKGFWQEEEKKLGLSQEQQDKMKALRENFRTKQKALREQMRAKHEALRQELDAATPDRAKAESLLKEINSLQAQTGSNRVDEIFQIRAILTPEQFQKLKEFREQKRAEFEKTGKGRKLRGPSRSDDEQDRGPGPEGE